MLMIVTAFISDYKKLRILFYFKILLAFGVKGGVFLIFFIKYVNFGMKRQFFFSFQKPVPEHSGLSS